MTDAKKIDANMLLQEWTAAGMTPEAQAERFGNMVSAAEPWVLVLAQQAHGKTTIEKVEIIKRIVKLLRPMPVDDRKIFLRLAADEAEESVEMFEALLEDEPVAEKHEAGVNVMRIESVADSLETRFHLYTAADALKPQEPIEYVVDGVFGAGSLSVVVGDPGSKKTWSMLDCLAAVSVGDPWLGHSTLPRSVLFIDEDNGKRRISARIGKALRAHGGTEDTLFFYTSLAGFDFGNSQDIDELRKLIIKTGAAIVVVDILPNVIPGKKENDATDIGPVLRALRYVAEETQAAIVLIHHLSKAGLIRGTSAINGAMDLALEVESKVESCDVNFKSTKVRDVHAFHFSGFAHFSEDKFYMTESEKSSIVTLNRAQDLVIQYLDTQPGATLEDIGLYASGGSVAERTMMNACRSLAGDRMGFTKKTGNGGGRGQKAVWSLTEKGQNYAKTIK